MIDMSYMACLELRGNTEDLKEGLLKVALDNDNEASTNGRVLADTEQALWIREPLGSKEVIGQVTTVWKSCRKVLWVWIHPAFYQVWSLTEFYSVDLSQSRIGVKKVRFQQTHNQGLRQLFLAVSWDLCA